MDRTTPRYACVAPLPVLKQLHELDALPKYHLLISTEVLKDPNGWGDFFNGLRASDYVIMDNGKWELGGESDAFDRVLAASNIVNADAIILPDVGSDMHQTVLRSSAAADYLFSHNIPLAAVGVAHGRNLTDLLQCATTLRANGAEILSVSRDPIRNGTISVRHDVVKEMLRRHERPMHLLGMSKNHFDDVRTALLPGVMGFDSAAPVWLGQQGFALEERPGMAPSKMTRPADYWSWQEVSPLAVENVRQVQAWLNAPHVVSPEQ